MAGDRRIWSRRNVLAVGAVAATLFGGGLVATGPGASAAPAWQDHATSWTTAARSPQVVGLRYAAHDRFDRVVIDVRGRIPGGRAHYARRFHYDGSGALVPIRGRSGLALTLQPAQTHDSDGTDVYTGPRLARPHLQTLKALAVTGEFEGTVGFGFALTHRASYRVFFLHHPQRLVVDFRHS